MSFKPTIIYIDDDRANLDSFVRAFRFDYDIKTALSGSEGLEILKKEPETSIIITDQRMPHMTGIEFLQKVIGFNPHPIRMILTAFTDNEALLKAIKEGHVYNYIVKPWKKDELKKVIDDAIAIYNERIEKIKQLMAAERKIEAYEEEIKKTYDFTHIIGWEGGLKEVMGKIEKVAPTQTTVLIRGETGCGKELIARAIHGASERNKEPFVPVHCAALSEGVLESELFGHEKGAFTGAIGQKKGRFELAHGGTLFLDEVGDLPMPVQIKLLRVLQERVIERVGGVTPIPTDVRIIAATHQPMEKLINEGAFREDLFYRLNVVPITVPPLRERKEDINDLISFFLEKYTTEMGKRITITEEARNLLTEYDWPGNIRELQNIIERTVILADGEIVDVADLQSDLAETVTIARSTIDVACCNPPSVRDTVNNEEAARFAKALKECKGNIAETARSLNMARSTLVHRLKKYKLI
jgi:two-component system NtrC family response regulator